MRCVGGAVRWGIFMKRGRRRAWITPNAKCFGNRNLGLWITRQAKINKAKPNYATGRPRGPSPVPKKPYKAISWTGEMLSALRQWWKRKNPEGGADYTVAATLNLPTEPPALRRRSINHLVRHHRTLVTSELEPRGVKNTRKPDAPVLALSSSQAKRERQSTCVTFAADEQQVPDRF